MLRAEQSINVRSLTIPNRIMRSATMENMADCDGFVSDDLVELYASVARGGAGLIVVGASAVEPRGKVWKNQLAVWDDGCIDALKRISDTIHENGVGKCAVQLHHGGTAGFGYSYGNGKSEFSINSAPPSEIEKVIATFGKAAARVSAAGFDAVAVHGAHGYLISQFLSPLINERTDRWGGSLDNRMRFGLEVCRSIRNEVAEDMPLLWKINCSDYQDGVQDLADYSEAARALVEAGVDLIEVSGGIKEQMRLRQELKKQAGEREAYFGQAIQPFRDATGTKTLAITGGLRSRNAIEEILLNGADMVGVSRPIISEPDFPKKILDSGDYEVVRCISCNKCLLHIAEHPLKCVHFEE